MTLCLRKSLVTPAALFFLLLGGVVSAVAADAPELKHRPVYTDTAYLLGPGDEVVIRVNEMEELADKKIRVDPEGKIDIPVTGRIAVAGLSTEAVAAQIKNSLLRILKKPEVTVNVVEYRSQPVSILGAVNQPGVYQLQGPKRLLELISQAGGTRPEAGGRVRVTREGDGGELPLPNAKKTGTVVMGDINLDDLMHGRTPESNIYIRPHDTVTIDRAELVYVIGHVKKAGGFVLAPHESISVLQVLSMAEGLQPTASASKARILRKNPEGGARIEIAVDLNRVLGARAPDVQMQSEDILLVPNNVARSISIRSAEAALQIGTGLVIWRR